MCPAIASPAPADPSPRIVLKFNFSVVTFAA
jgi:hypothetical protein